MTSDKAIEIHTFYSQLLQSYAILSEDEIRDSVLNEESKHKKISWQSFGQHIQHLRAALALNNLSEDRKEAISFSLARQQEEYDEYLWQPEALKGVSEGDREALIARRLHLTKGYYYTDEKEVWKTIQAEGSLSEWTDAPRNLINEIDRKLWDLDNLLTNPLQGTSRLSFRQPTIVPMLTLEQQERAFMIRWDEFRDVVNISFSSPDDDANIKVYNAAVPPQESSGAGLWCPMITNGFAHEPWLWLGFSQQKRDAIRSGFIQGMCRIINCTVANPIEWRAQSAELSPHLFTRYFNPITEQTYRTKQYAKGRKELRNC